MGYAIPFLHFCGIIASEVNQMSNTYTTTITLGTRDCDMYGSWKPSAILECMQETAGIHGTAFGCGRNLLDECNLVWVISRVKVQMNRLPRYGETITVETYPTAPRLLFFPRSHIFRSESGEEIGSANSLWVLLDVEQRRIVKSDLVASRMPDNHELKPAAGMPATVRLMEGESLSRTIEPQFADFDLNQHVNNTRYLDWCLNALGTDRLRNQCVKSFDVNYDAEILPGSAVRTELALAADRFAFVGFEGEKQHFAIGGQLQERD